MAPAHAYFQSYVWVLFWTDVCIVIAFHQACNNWKCLVWSQTAQLEDAKLLLQEELMELNKEQKYDGSVTQEDLDAWSSAVDEFIYVPNQQRYGRIASTTNSDKIESLQASFLWPFHLLSHSII